MTTKNKLRKEIEAQRNALDFQWLEMASAQVARNFQTLETFHSAEMVALYMSIAGEIQMDALFPKCWKLGKRTCIPIFNAETKIYEMAEITRETHIKTGHYGIREPVYPSLISTESIDLMAVPGIAFDSQGNRLGRGGGYYDRLLNNFRGYSAAVAFDFQILKEIPCEPHDVPVNGIVTDTKLLKVRNER